MRLVIGWLIVGVLVIVLIYIIGNNICRMFAKLTNRKPKYNYADEFLRRTECKYNRAHLPSTELPELAPDWLFAEKFIMETRFRFTDEGYRFAYLALVNNSYETKYFLKSEFTKETLKLIEFLSKDVNWFYANPTGVTLSEQDYILTGFLKEKYSGLSERSISRISHTYCMDNR